jgi:hypothetical protein
MIHKLEKILRIKKEYTERVNFQSYKKETILKIMF